jgi:leucyl aminopeptidase (aminopeptidase T)
MPDGFYIKDFELLDRLDWIKTLADKGRMAMVSLLAREPLTGSMVAERLGMPANLAHYHIKRLLSCGLLREAEIGPRRRRDERYYIATARHFLVDPQLGCGEGEAAAAVLRSVDAAFLDWRRRQILNVDLAQVAARVVRDCLRIRSGETVLVMFGPLGLELGEAILVEVEAIGARARPKLWSRNTLLGTVDRHSSESLAHLPFLDPDIDRELDAVVYVSSTIPQGAPPSPEQREKLPHRLEAVSRWHQSLRDRRVRYLEVGLPYRGELEAGGVTPEDAIDIFWHCIATDYEDLARRARCLRARIDEGFEEWIGHRPILTFSCARGTELAIEIDIEHSLVCDGVVSDEDIMDGKTFDQLPAGYVAFLPVAQTANGLLLADYTFHRGIHFWDVRIELRNGRIVGLDAGNNADVLRQSLAAAVGDADLIAGVQIGLNPAGRGPTGKPSLDGCLEGVFTFAFGNNELMGGDVRSTFNLVLPCGKLTCRAGNLQLTHQGKLPESMRTA